MAYKYLSDPIVLYFTLPESLAGTNVNFTVTDEATGVPLYNGSVYATGKKQKLVLNDIATLLQDDYDWFRNTDSDTNHPTTIITDSPTFATLVVSFDGSYIYEVPEIVLGRSYPNATGSIFIPSNGDNELVTMNEWGTGVIPRIPKSTKVTSKFFTMFGYVYAQSTHANANRITLSIINGTGQAKPLNHSDISDDPTMTKVLYGPATINSMITTADDFKYLAAALYNGSMIVTPYKIVANIDNDPADYYISWINRYGAWQCQPMCAKWEMSEKVTTESITTLDNETIPHTKTSEYNWTLNSHWLNYAEHEEFESLLHSKYIYLFSPKYNEGHFVNITDSNWTFKNEVNTKKPFNLTVNLTKSQKQNIVL